MVRFSQLHKTIPYHLHKNIILIHLKFLNTFFKNKPIPLVYWIKFSSLIDYLFPSLQNIYPHYTSIESMGYSISTPELWDILKDEIIDRWTLDKRTIEFLWSKIILSQPKTIIECGSGISTIIFGKYADIFYKINSYLPVIISLEQNPEVKKSIEEKLKIMGLKNAIKIIYSPVNENGNYIGDKNDLKEILANEKADLILIDGPSGPPGCRVNTIYYLSDFCKKNTKWFLDDSFRNGELWALRQWENMAGIKVQGIYPFGKGLGVGEIEDPIRIVDKKLYESR